MWKKNKKKKNTRLSSFSCRINWNTFDTTTRKKKKMKCIETVTNRGGYEKNKKNNFFFCVVFRRVEPSRIWARLKKKKRKKKVIRNEKVVVVVVVGRNMYIIIHSRRKKKKEKRSRSIELEKKVYRQCWEFEIRDEERNIYTGIKKKSNCWHIEEEGPIYMQVQRNPLLIIERTAQRERRRVWRLERRFTHTYISFFFFYRLIRIGMFSAVGIAQVL